MNLLKHSGNSSLQDVLAETLKKSYVLKGGASAFIVDQTNLFYDHEGTQFFPYKKQVHFMNLLRPQDRLVVVLKPRQCCSEDTLIKIDDNKQVTIKELYEQNYRGKCKTFDFDDWKDKEVEDEIIDIWESGCKKIYKLLLEDGKEIKCSKKHRFNTQYGWLELKDIELETRILTEGGNWKKVIEITDLNYEEMTYDLTTKKYHSYIANGIHCHNSGFSTSIVGRAVWEAYFGKVNEIVIVSASRTQAEKVIDRIKEAFYSMDETIRPSFKADNKQQLFLNNGVKIYSLASNPDTMRGFTGIAYIDEFAMISVKDSYEIYKALYPSTTKGGRLVFISTPKGKDGKFYDLATKSLATMSGRAVQNESVIYRIEWKDVPHIVDAVENHDLFAGMTPEEIDQEYGLLFTNDDEESLFTIDFLMSNFVERDDIIDLFTTYEELGIPNELMNDWNEPLDPAYYLKNNRNYEALLDRYERFVGGWDTAFANDDSFFVVMGINRKTKQKEIIFEKDLKIISSNLITQAKYARRIIDFFSLEQLSIDIKGVGNSVKDYYSADDSIVDICNFFTYTNQNKVDNFLRLKDDINMGLVKRRYDGTKYDNNVLKQATNLFYKGGKIIGRGGKDDYFNAVMLANESSKNTVGGGFWLG